MNIPDLPTSRLSELPAGVLRSLLATLQNKYPSPIVLNPIAIATEEGRLKLAFDAGQHQVVRDLMGIIKAMEPK